MSDSTFGGAPEQPPYQPTPRDLILLDLPSQIGVSPSGRRVAYSVRTTNWQKNCYEWVCYLYDTATDACHPLNRTGSVTQLEWLDDQTVALLKNGSAGNGESQVWLHEGIVGEGWQATAHEGGVSWFAPFADGILYCGLRPENERERTRADHFGVFTHVEQEESRSALYYVALDALRLYQHNLRTATTEAAKQLVRPVLEVSQLLPALLSIRSVIPCPTGRAIYLNCQEHDDLVHYRTSTTYRIALDPTAALAAYQERLRPLKVAVAEDDDALAKARAEALHDLGTVTRLPLPLCASVDAVSPNGAQLLIDYQGRDDKLYTRSDLWLLDCTSALQATSPDACLAAMRNLSAPLDRDLFNPQWTAQGIFAGYVDGTATRLVRLDPAGTVTPLDLHGQFCAGAFHVGAQGDLGFIGVTQSSYPEAYLMTLTPPANGEPALRQLSNCGRAVADWQLGTVETVRWPSRDGVEIEGVLRKPVNFDPNKRYPLVFVVHGGPRGYSDASLIANVDRMYYPAIQFANADMLVLYPNYRGSTGRGQAFTELNVNNLGIGDLWDLESAIDHLAGLGWIDEGRVGCMGWSQGGYISAFAGLHSERFRAVSVGAGISDWYTYHISNDIPYFTTHYLSDSPFHNRELYAPTAPMSNIANAKTPMLIQHGAEDRRVPLSNAMELYRGLQAMGVPVELFVYPGMGHPITRPRENHAVMQQNWAWFAHYLLGAPLELPT
jgi:dipeptidyl aminopeptidase/acylaminoacyl peptidase